MRFALYIVALVGIMFCYLLQAFVNWLLWHHALRRHEAVFAHSDVMTYGTPHLKHHAVQAVPAYMLDTVGHEGAPMDVAYQHRSSTEAMPYD